MLMLKRKPNDFSSVKAFSINAKLTDRANRKRQDLSEYELLARLGVGDSYEMVKLMKNPPDYLIVHTN